MQLAGDDTRDVEKVFDQTRLRPAGALDRLNRSSGLCGIELPTGE
jgi:hypothetical protein